MNTKRRKSLGKLLQKDLKRLWPTLLLATSLLIVGVAILFFFSPDYLGDQTFKTEGHPNFEYPSYWGKLELASLEGVTETYYADNPEVALVLYHRQSNTVVFVRNTSPAEYIYESIDAVSRDVVSAEQTLNILKAGVETKLLDKEQDYGRMYQFKYSPTGRYIAFEMASTGQFDAKIFDLVERKDIFKPIASRIGIDPAGLSTSQIMWSEDESILAIDFYDFEVGPPHLLVSDFGNPTKMNVVASWETLQPPLPDQSTLSGFSKLTIDNVAITSPDIVEFSAEVCENCYPYEERDIIRSGQYRYHAQTKKLEHIK